MSEPKKNTAFIFVTQLVSQANAPDFQANPTLAAGDVTVSIDGANPANITTLPTAINSGKNVKVSLSAAEMNGDYITVLFSDAAGAEWHDTAVNINTVAYTSTDIFGNIVSTVVNIDNTTQEYTAYSNTDFSIRAYIVDTDGSTPLNIGDATAIVYEIAATKSDSTALVQKTLAAGDIVVSNGNGTNDLATITMDAADTTALSGRYYHQLKITDAASDTQIYLSGWITILQDLSI